jgi:hypothetical protein
VYTVPAPVIVPPVRIISPFTTTNWLSMSTFIVPSMTKSP